jgi:hypothetical protein
VSENITNAIDVSVGEHIRVPWSNGAGHTVYQLRDDEGSGPHVLHRVHDVEYDTSAVKWREGLSYPGNEPENGPARRVPVDGCRNCGSDSADEYDESGLGEGCCVSSAEDDGRPITVGDTVRVVYAKHLHRGKEGVVISVQDSGEQLTVRLSNGDETQVAIDDMEVVSWGTRSKAGG